jgi:DNA replication protein DnaC
VRTVPSEETERPMSPLTAALVERALENGRTRAVPEPSAEDRAAERRRAQDRERTAVRDANATGFAEQCPEHFATATFADVDIPERRLLERWAADPGPRNLVLAGTVGCGKTHTALAVSRSALEQATTRRTFAFATTVDLMDGLRPHGPRGLFRRVATADLLVLDDLGVERPTDWVAQQLTGVLDARWREGRPTVVTTNLTVGAAGQLAQALDERAYSRLVGRPALVLRMTGADRRRRAS